MASSNPENLFDQTTSRLGEKERRQLRSDGSEVAAEEKGTPRNGVDFAEVRESSPWKLEESCRETAWGRAALNPIPPVSVDCASLLLNIGDWRK